LTSLLLPFNLSFSVPLMRFFIFCALVFFRCGSPLCKIVQTFLSRPPLLPLLFAFPLRLLRTGIAHSCLLSQVRSSRIRSSAHPLIRSSLCDRMSRLH
jgi:hypothetical protein